MTPAPPPPPVSRPTVPRAFGRFELRHLLARSQRTMLWLAWDPRVSQEMLLTLPRAALPDAAAAQAWADHARHAARLSHPRLVPVIDHGVHELWPYVACDRGAGQTLVEWLAVNAMPSHQEIARWLCQALEALAYAHEAGTSHRDLQPHQLLVDDRGNLRVMAFSVAPMDAASLAAGGLSASRGMPLDPAQLRAHRASAERDVLGLGVIAHQMFAGVPALDERDVARVIERIAPLGADLLRLPWTTPQPISDTLRLIVNRATHAQPRQRYLAARSLLRALDGWRESDARDNGGPVALLLERLESVGHLPAIPGMSLAIARLSRMEKQRTFEMAEQVLLDLALSFDLLRLVNSAQVRGTQVSGNGPVLTIRRAISMIGVDGVRHAATALRAWPGPLGEAEANALRLLIERVRLAGHLAQQLRPAGYDAEVVFLLAALQNLGRLLLQYHFPEDAEQVVLLMQPLPGATPDVPDQPGMSESSAALTVLGVEIDAFATAAARQWGLTDEVLHMIRRLPVERPVRQPDSDADVLRATASAANEVVDAITRLAPNRLGAALEGIARRYGKLLNMSARDLGDAVRAARHAQAAGLPILERGSAGDDEGELMSPPFTARGA